MNYLRIEQNDVSNGPGFRVTLFVAGCNHKCEGCWSPHSWNRNNGFLFTKEIQDEVIRLINLSHHRGLSLSGGDPMFPGNRTAILELVKRVKAECPGKDIWMWSGFTREQLESIPLCKEILSHIDVLIDGRYDHSKRDLFLEYRGSSNQRVIFLKKT